MESHMLARLATLSIFPFPLGEAIVDRFFAIARLEQGPQPSQASRKRAEAVSELKERILYDIGESNMKPFCSPIGINNPYQLLIDGIMNRGTSELDYQR
jgi:hypothetical protein